MTETNIQTKLNQYLTDQENYIKLRDDYINNVEMELSKKQQLRNIIKSKTKLLKPAFEDLKNNNNISLLNRITAADPELKSILDLDFPPEYKFSKYEQILNSYEIIPIATNQNGEKLAGQPFDPIIFETILDG